MSHRAVFRWLSNLCAVGGFFALWFLGPDKAAAFFALGALNAAWGLYE